MAAFDPSTWALAASVTLLAAVVQASLGIGFGMIAGPVLFLIDPALVPGPIILIGVVVTGFTAWRDFGDVNRPAVAAALSGRVPGALGAAWVMSMLPVDIFAALFGVLIIAAVALNVSGILLPARLPVIFGAGLLSGVMGTTTSAGAPPLALVFQGYGGAGMRATASATLVIGALISLTALALFGRFGWAEAGVGLSLAPVAFAGFWLSGPIAKWLDRRLWRPAMYLVSAASGALCVVQAIGV